MTLKLIVYWSSMIDLLGIVNFTIWEILLKFTNQKIFLIFLDFLCTMSLCQYSSLVWLNIERILICRPSETGYWQYCTVCKWLFIIAWQLFSVVAGLQEEISEVKINNCSFCFYSFEWCPQLCQWTQGSVVQNCWNCKHDATLINSSFPVCEASLNIWLQWRAGRTD